MADSRHITRRAAIVGVASTAALTVPQVEAKSIDLQSWLDAADPATVVNFHLSRLTEAMQKIEPGYWTGQVSENKDFVLISRDPSRAETANYVRFFY